MEEKDKKLSHYFSEDWWGIFSEKDILYENVRNKFWQYNYMDDED